MGMFDTVRCDYPITSDFLGECQTKDFGSTMDHYYIDPAGVIWVIDYHGTHNVFLNKDTGSWFKFHYQPTGDHGRVYPHLITDYVTIYPTNHDGSWETWPKARLHIINGKIESFTLIIKGTTYV